ncbi:nitrous oxide reductase accessory protein NosL [Pontibacter sp. HSC-14F20]|uniref:nitrous oxide reductase accessory protein NosL n=1 Tax=Pontibacter sp. HSC-14F20 TaxID=2864136 RepID=UPI001C73CC9C|nr:nitrous oxide reductase accessory protein NosL [Pontibacter sp. HSC-14F20]MBX0332296.1 nitrous oxide reductase accessory protein NosL [Pontibacter sp. HSC-14F20]
MKSLNLYLSCLVLLFVLLLAGCQVEPQPIAYGEVNCAHCQMTVSDNRYGAEMINDKGKPFYFDSAECLALYLDQNPDQAEKAAYVLVTDFTKPGELMDARSASFIQSKELPSPMGMYLTAVADEATATRMQQEVGGRLLNWEQAMTSVKSNEKPE